MTDYFQLGKEVILAATEAQLEVFKKAEKPTLASDYGATTDLYEIALRRIGENELADKFINPNPDVSIIVERMSSDNSPLVSIIASIERGDLEFAREIEEKQRRYFYIPDAGYWEPHFRDTSHNPMYRCILPSNPKAREIISQKIKENGPEESLKHPTQFCKDRYGTLRGHSLGRVSSYEAILAIASNIILSRKNHAKRVLDELFSLYLEGDELIASGCCETGLPGFRLENTSRLCKVADLLNDTRGRELYERNKEKFESPSEKDFQLYEGRTLKEVNFVTSLSLLYCLDHFGNEEGATKLRERISYFDAVRFKRVITSPDFDHETYGPKENKGLLECGLALTGLESGKPNYMYTT